MEIYTQHEHNSIDLLELELQKWTIIATNNPYTLNFSESTIMDMAKNSSRILIRSANNPLYYLVSLPESLPILRLRQGKDLCQSNMNGDMLGGDMTEELVQKCWQGPSKNILKHLENHWGSDIGNACGMQRLYWSCCNPCGLHFLPSGQFGSGWGFGMSDDIEILLDTSKQVTNTKFSKLLYDPSKTLHALDWGVDQTVFFIENSICNTGPWEILCQLVKSGSLNVRNILSNFGDEKSLIFNLIRKDKNLIAEKDPGFELVGMFRHVRLLALYAVANSFCLEEPKQRKEFIDLIDSIQDSDNKCIKAMKMARSLVEDFDAGVLSKLKPRIWESKSRFIVGLRIIIQDIGIVSPTDQTTQIKFILTLFWWHPVLCDWNLPLDSEELKDFDSTCDALEPKPDFLNAVDDPLIKSIKRTRRMRLNCISSTYEVFGTFHDIFHVKNFPFDDQEFKIRLGIKSSSLGMERFLVPIEPNMSNNIYYDSDIQHPEWILCPIKVKFLDCTEVHICLNLSRKAYFYLLNVVSPLVFISSIAFTAFFIDSDSFVDRFSLLGTILLTTVAMKFTYAESVPKVSYATLLDIYVMAIFAIEFSLIIACGVVSTIQDEEFRNESDEWILYSLIIIYFLLHLALLIFFRRIGYHK